MPESAQGSDLHARVERVLSAQYELDREIGRGGMGIVYKARDRRLKRVVAVKILPPELTFNPDVKSRFLREAETAAQLSHPNIVPIYTVDDRDGLVFFVMGYVDGKNLGAHLSEQGQLRIEDARCILREVADALAYAHEQGVVHRDIKPDNILLAAANGRAMVTDFGIARAMSGGSDSRLTGTGVAIGTPAYMSPEQCAGEPSIDGRSDLYSLGVVTYEMLVGRPPFVAANTPAMFIKHVSERPISVEQLRSDIPEDLRQIVMTLLEKEPANRFPNGAALVAALDSGIVPERKTGAMERRPATSQTSGDQSARSSPAPWLPPVPDLPGPLGRRAAKRAAKRKAQEEMDAKPLAARIRDFRLKFIGYIGTTLFLFGINAVTSPEYWWAVFPALGMGMGIMKPAGRLWADGVRLRDIFGGGTPLGIPEGKSAQLSSPPPSVPQLPPDEAAKLVSHEVLDGPYGSTLRQAVSDRKIVVELYSKVGPADRALLPDVAQTADGLLERIAALASALNRVDVDIKPTRIAQLDARIKELEDPGAVESERTLALLRRQRKMLGELVASRASLFQQFESAGLLLQNMRLDLLKLRSAGIQAVVDDVTSATQEARALSREIEHVLGAADELRALT
ncbi:MAG: protein kinase [Gemmatimonadaceae bacterium]